jgi:drug/metabolite transporter (DMT)-like permease
LAAGALTPGAATAYTYLTPFVSMLLIFAADPQRISWHWLPGSLLGVLAIALLLRRDGDRSTSWRSLAAPSSQPARCFR